MARMDAMTLKMDAEYKELQSNAKKMKPELDDDDTPMSREEEDKFMQTFYKVLLKLDWAKNQKTKSTLKKTAAFIDEGSSNSDTDKIMARMDAMTLKMDAEYKELQSNAKKMKPELDDDDTPMSREEEDKFMQTFSDLGASINLMTYSLSAKLSLKTLKPTKMSIRLANISFQYPVGIAENILIEVGKFTFPADFVILKMKKIARFP
nr:reverse transcriptase domain-containing protein [Tanacetum cinerariifolium]